MRELFFQVCTPFPVKEFIYDFEVKYRHVIVLFKFFIYYAFPLCVIACFYVLMAIHLEASTRNMPGESQGQTPQVKARIFNCFSLSFKRRDKIINSFQIRARKKVAKLVLVFVVIFIVCFGPYHVFMLWFHLNPNSWKNFNNLWNAFRILGFCLSYFNSCINPIALYFISGTFR